MVITRDNLNDIKNYNLKDGAVFLVNKPFEWTSFDVVNKFKFLFKQNLGEKNIKIGHAGTLDPLATGLVIVCCGKMTKEIDKFQVLDKQYKTLIKLGETTASFDLESEVDETFDISHITENLVVETLKKFTGEIQQMPPIFSAKKINGKRAYSFARKGREVMLNPVNINISKIELCKFNLPHIEILVDCSKGTYIRSLANDIGKALGSGAYLAALERTRIGSYNILEAFEVPQFEKIIKEMKVLVE